MAKPTDLLMAFVFCASADAAFAANPLAPNPAEVLQQKTKQAQNAAKGVANKAGIPDPVRPPPPLPRLNLSPSCHHSIHTTNAHTLHHTIFSSSITQGCTL